MKNDKPNETGRQTSYSNIDWENRLLCEDGNCIGVIGPDGKCKECGKKYEGALPENFDSEEQTPSDGPGETDDLDASAQTAADDSVGQDDASDDWANRQLCSDGNCIGVIGRDGRCKECGKPME